MTTQRMIEKFNGKPIDQLNWRELIAYNLASVRVQAASGLLSGDIACGVEAQHGITCEYEEKRNSHVE